MLLLCWRHHHDFAHHPQWHLKLLPDATVDVTKPDGKILTSRPPPPGDADGCARIVAETGLVTELTPYGRDSMTRSVLGNDPNPGPEADAARSMQSR